MQQKTRKIKTWLKIKIRTRCRPRQIAMMSHTLLTDKRKKIVYYQHWGMNWITQNVLKVIRFINLTGAIKICSTITDQISKSRSVKFKIFNHLPWSLRMKKLKFGWMLMKNSKTDTNYQLKRVSFVFLNMSISFLCF